MMKKILLCLTLLALVLTMPCLAATAVSSGGAVYTVPDAAPAQEPAGLFAVSEGFTQDGVIYTFTNSGDSAQVAGYTADIPQVCVIPESVTIAGTDYPVTALADNALYNCAKLTSLTLPETVTRLGEKSLAGCTGLTEVTIPATVTSIAADALRDCTGLTAITVAEDNAGGYHGDGLALFDSGKKLLQYALGAPQTDYAVSEGTTIIGIASFRGAVNLRSVVMPDSVRKIESGAFYACKALRNVELGNGVEELDDAFAESGLVAIHLPALVREVSSGAFRDCENLAEITVAEENERYYAQDGVLFDRQHTNYGMQESALALIVYPAGNQRTAYTVPAEVVGIGYNAFWNSKTLTDLTLPEGLEYIGASAITASGLTHLEIPDSVTLMGNHSVQTCKNMTTARLGAGITKIPDGLFQYCSSLRTVNIPAGVTEIGTDVLNRCENLESITVDENNTAFQNVDGVVYDKEGTTLVLCPAAIERFTLPATVTQIASGAFASCTKLTDFQVAEGNGTFYAQDGVLFQNGAGEKKTLVAYPAGKTATAYTVPAGVTALAPRCFDGVQHLTELNTNDVTDVGTWAIYNKSVTKLTLPKVERVDRYGIYATHAATVTLPATLQSIGNQTFDYSDYLEWVTFTAQTPPENIQGSPGFYAVLYHCPALRYVYVPAGTQMAYKNALAGSVAPGAMIVEGTYVPKETVVERIEALTDSSDVAAVNTAAQGIVRLLTAQQAELSDAAIAKADRLFAAAHADLSVAVEQSEVTSTSLQVTGLAVASGLVERQDEAGKVSGDVTLTAVEAPTGLALEPLALEFALEVDGAPAQPKSPVVITVDLPADLAGQDFKLLHRDGESETEVPVTVAGDKATFRATSFSSYVFRLANHKYLVDYTTPTAATLFVAGYQNGRMVSVQGFDLAAGSDSVEFAGQAGVTYKAFLLGSGCVPVGEASVTLPDR